MFGTISEEIEVKAAASEVWKVYSTFLLAKLVVEHQLIHKIDLLEGDGGAGTVLLLTFPPGTPEFSSYKEKFIVVDNEKRVKVAEMIEGGYLNLGVEKYLVRLEVIEEKQKDEGEGEGEGNSCITKVTVEYQTKDLAAAVLALNSIQIFLAILNTVADYLTKTQQNNNNHNHD